jgi:hypothetical protein
MALEAGENPIDGWSIPRVAILVGLIAFIGGGIAYRVHANRPLSEPESATRSVFAAAATGDLDAVQRAATPEFYRSFVEVFGEDKLQKVQFAYRQLYNHGLPQWNATRGRAFAASLAAYDQLRARVTALGREAFTKLSVDRRLQLIEQRTNDAYIFEAGLSALPPEEQRLIQDREAFRAGRDASHFAESRLWQFASDDDKKALGSAAALSATDTPEKLAFIDRVGLPQLPPELKREIGDIKRSELADQATFRFTYGEPLARDYLARKQTPAAVTVDSCRFRRADAEGGLLRGTESTCVVRAPVAGSGPIPVSIVFQKVDVRWLVRAMDPPLYAVKW